MINKSDFSQFGIGTFGIGGFMEKNPSSDDRLQIDAIRYSLERGLNYLDISFLYAEGYTNELVRDALKGIDKDKLFVNAKLGNIESPQDIEKQLDEYLDFFDFDYIDSFQIHSPSRIKPVGIEKTTEAIMRLVDKQKTRYFSVSNFGPENLKKAQEASGHDVFSLENDYSFDVRPCEDIGLLDYCKQYDILFIPYRPIRREGRGLVSNLNYQILTEIAEKYQKSQNQILLNWYAWKEGVMSIVKSTNQRHIDENLASFDFKMTEAEYKKLDNFRIKNPAWEKIDWEYEGNGDTKISNLSFTLE